MIFILIVHFEYEFITFPNYHSIENPDIYLSYPSPADLSPVLLYLVPQVLLFGLVCAKDLYEKQHLA